MKTSIALSVALLAIVCAPSFAGEAILKDGRNITWKSVSDDGTSLTFTLPNGKTVVVEKSDVDRITTGMVAKSDGPDNGILTGATFTFDKKRKFLTTNLLASADPGKDGITGTWSRGKNGSLVGTPPMGALAKLQFSSYRPPEEYDLRVVIERTDGGNGVSIGMPAPDGKHFSVNMDHMAGTTSAFHDKVWEGKFFENGKPRTLTFMVRKNAFVFQADGKDFIVWKGDWSQVKRSGGTVRADDVFYVMLVSDGGYRISGMTVTAPKE